MVNASSGILAPQRSILLNLSEVERLSDRTRLRLTTGRDIHNATDDAIAFFKNKELMEQAGDLTSREDLMVSGLGALNASIDALEAIESLLENLKSVVERSKGASTTMRTANTSAFNSIMRQIYDVVEDNIFSGNNLLNNTGNELTVSFSARSASQLVVPGLDLTSTGATPTAYRLFSAVSFPASDGNSISMNDTDIHEGIFGTGSGLTGLSLVGNNTSLLDFGVTTINTTISRLRGHMASLSNHSIILSTRLDFTKKFTDTLETGANKLVSIDLTEESARLTALQLRQSLGMQSLNIFSDMQQSALRLLQ